MSQHAKQEVNWEFLLNSSKSTLQAYEQSRLNFAANVRKEIAQLLQIWVDESSNALLARWLIERNLAADPDTLCPSAGPGSSGPASASGSGTSSGPSSPAALQVPHTQIACGPQDAPKLPSRAARSAVTSTQLASDKIFGEKPFTPSRIHAAS